jgi:hypothetical protein
LGLFEPKLIRYIDLDEDHWVKTYIAPQSAPRPGRDRAARRRPWPARAERCRTAPHVSRGNPRRLRRQPDKAEACTSASV